FILKSNLIGTQNLPEHVSATYLDNLIITVISKLLKVTNRISWDAQIPFSPGRPGSPLSPGSPDDPCDPGGPECPCIPLGPGRPFFPTDPGEPMSPRWPLEPGKPEKTVCVTLLKLTVNEDTFVSFPLLRKEKNPSVRELIKKVMCLVSFSLPSSSSGENSFFLNLF
uniref:Uncharacterized protein n=1 Tax=Crocodylus porosus TaxID=8502 RepID=A0A7M4E8I0_CROPO